MALERLCLSKMPFTNRETPCNTVDTDLSTTENWDKKGKTKVKGKNDSYFTNKGTTEHIEFSEDEPSQNTPAEIPNLEKIEKESKVDSENMRILSRILLSNPAKVAVKSDLWLNSMVKFNFLCNIFIDNWFVFVYTWHEYGK